MAKRPEPPKRAPVPVPRESEPESRSEIVSRLSLPLTADGTRIDLDRMRDSTREQLRKLLDDPKLRPPTSAAAPGIPPMLVDTLITTLGTIEQSLAVRFLNCPPRLASVLAYTDKDLDALRDPTVRVLDKHLGAWFSKHGDEAELATTFGLILVGKLTTLRMEIAKYHEAQRAPRPVPRVTPAPPPSTAVVG